MWIDNNTGPNCYYSPLMFALRVGRPIGSISVINAEIVHLQRLNYWLCLRFSRWSLNGTLIDLGNNYRRHMSGGNLIINNLDKDQDAGIYQCAALNARGSILSRKASLQFTCKWSYISSHPSGINPQHAVYLPVYLFVVVCQCVTRLWHRPFAFSSLILHLDCQGIDFWEGNGNRMKCQLQQTQWVKQLLTASDLHWFSLVLPTLTASMLSPNWLIFCQVIWQTLWSRL